MQVILLKDVEKVGLRGDVVNVADGYARNFLLPRRLAEKANTGAVANLRRHEELRARHEARSADDAERIAETLRKTVLSFEVKSGPTGALFGSVTATDVADELWRTRKVRVDRRKIGLGESIKRIGRYSVAIEVFGDVSAEVKTLVVPEGGELPPEEELEAMAAAETAAAEAEAAPAEDVEWIDEEVEAAAPAGEPEPSGVESADEAPAAEALAPEAPEPAPPRQASSADEPSSA